MNRSLGLTTGAILMLGVLLRTGAGGAPALATDAGSNVQGTTGGMAARPVASIAKTAKKLTGEGPWMASCRYWETSSGLDYPAKADKEAQISLQFKSGSGKVESKLSATSAESPSECEQKGDAWGIPPPPASTRKNKSKPQTARVKPRITAIIATVPDPLHTHLALEFDRDIDAILHAAAENGYLFSQYWMPWQSPEERPGGPTAAARAEADSGEQQKRELQPGLIVLKYAGRNSGESSGWSSYDRVIYLFLVGESPASGMNGAQLRNALRYEAMLKKRNPSVDVDLSMRGKGDLAVIGSPNSGAAVSLREAIEAAKGELDVTSVHIAGSTDTAQANDALQQAFADGSTNVQYISFGEDFEYEEHETLNLLSNSGYATDRVALLVEDGTVFGYAGTTLPEGYGRKTGDPSVKASKSVRKQGLSPFILRFPREISLLRNAQASDTMSSAPTPYLHLTLKDPAANDTVPHFSAEQTPLSQEATLMSIQRELVAYHAQFLAIQATNMLDQIYLANYFHRACPNIRLIFLGGGDLLLEREVDNVPYIGSVSMTPYNLVGLMRIPPHAAAARAFPDSQSEAMFNAASYVFQDQTSIVARASNPGLASYQGVLNQAGVSQAGVSQAGVGSVAHSHASLWATVIGADGYYPLGVASSCASDLPQSIPDFVVGQPQICVPKNRYPEGKRDGETRQVDAAVSDEMQQFARTAHLFPSLTWTVLSIVLGLYCIGHGVVVLVADFWSPFTRDVAIRYNDQPSRRSVYMNIGAVMLFSMLFVLEWPVFRIGPVLTVNHASVSLAIAMLGCGVFALFATFWKTRRYSYKLPGFRNWQDCNSYQAACLFFNLVAIATLFAIPITWAHLCSLDAFGELHTNYGVFFSYRCLHPDSEVSPVVPVLLVLFAWYLWAFCQTYRLRFSKAGRPRLPGLVVSDAPLPLYVTDGQLDDCANPKSASLYANITCLLITRELLVRFVPRLKTGVSLVLAVGYVSIFAIFMHVKSIESVDRMVLDPGRRPTCFEALIVALIVPLLAIGVAGWVRMVLIWGSLRRGLLERLEMYPLRNAFTRLKGVGWVAMMRDTGLHLRWRDMARANESIRQLSNNDTVDEVIQKYKPQSLLDLQNTYLQLETHVKEVVAQASGSPLLDHSARGSLHNLSDLKSKDLPDPKDIIDLELIAAIESDYAAVCEGLLEAVLIPYWTRERGGFVEGEGQDSAPIHAKRKQDSGAAHDPIELHAGSTSGDPDYIRLAEELLALRYFSLIRAVLGNIRYLMTFVSAVFVLALVAWNSYPFQPRELVDWGSTLAFLVLGSGIIWVFAQMHRNAILSRITDTAPNELGLDFYWRLVTFGAIPLLTWLSYQFPQAWSGIFRLVQPGLSSIK